MLGDGSGATRVGYTQPLQTPIAKKTPPSQSIVVPKLIMMWTIDRSLMDQNQQT
jgi:hypothetical protein